MEHFFFETGSSMLSKAALNLSQLNLSVCASPFSVLFGVIPPYHHGRMQRSLKQMSGHRFLLHLRLGRGICNLIRKFCRSWPVTLRCQTPEVCLERSALIFMGSVTPAHISSPAQSEQEWEVGSVLLLSSPLPRMWLPRLYSPCQHPGQVRYFLTSSSQNHYIKKKGDWISRGTVEGMLRPPMISQILYLYEENFPMSTSQIMNYAP